MKEILLILNKEWMAFAKSDRGIFVIYGILILMWSFILSSNITMLASESGTLWLVFFSVIVSGNFSTTTFVAERLNGSLEILLTCGVSRQSILAGKVLFVIAMATIMGLLCYGFALVYNGFKYGTVGVILSTMPPLEEIILYVSACFMNASCGAALSLRITNPRYLPFINLFILGVIVTLYMILSQVFSFTAWLLVGFLLVTGALFFVVAYHDYKTERIIQPFVY